MLKSGLSLSRIMEVILEDIILFKIVFSVMILGKNIVIKKF